MPISPTPRHQVIVQTVWTVADAQNASLTGAALARLGPYLVRYGETMGLRVRAVGGVVDHVHLLADLPPNLATATVTTELQRASARFVRDAVGVADFAWDEEAYMVSVSPDRADEVAEYIATQTERHTSGDLDASLEGTEPGDGEPETDETPAWLRDAMRGGSEE